VSVPYQSKILQPTLEQTPQLVAYCAGFFDGEGSIGFPGGASNRTILLTASQRVAPPLLLFQQLFGGSIYSPSPPGDVTFKWQRTGMHNCVPILEALQPYLIVKAAQAELALEWCALAPGSASSGRTVDRGLHSRREMIIDELKALKRPWLQGGDAL
jgi:hypothetical protein